MVFFKIELNKNSKVMSSKKSKCPVCRKTAVDIILEISQVPAHCNLLWLRKKDANQAPRGDIKLGFCRNCGHIFNIVFRPELMEYTQAYENSLHFSPCFQKYAESLAVYLVDKYDLHDKDIIEIGCGKGDFLRLLCELGENRGVGFDPTYDPEQNVNKKTKAQTTFIQDFYSEKYSHYKADFICCRQVLEHIQFACEFLWDLRRSIGKRTDILVFFEVPNVLFTLKDLGIWDLIYEHYSYFSPHSLSFLFSSCGFKVNKIRKTYNDQYLNLYALPGKNLNSLNKDLWNNFEELTSSVITFADRYRQKIRAWENKLKKMNQSKKRAVVWGGGSKGVTFLNILKVHHQIEYVVDINPRKQGKYIAGTGQQIVSPEFLRKYKPNVIIVMNPIYRNEIRSIKNRLGLKEIKLICA